MNLKELQEYSDRQLAKFKQHYDLNGRELALAINTKLMEECGEMADQLLGFYKLQRGSKLHQYSQKELEKELFDALFTVFGVASATGIDLSKIVQERADFILDRDLKD